MLIPQTTNIVAYCWSIADLLRSGFAILSSSEAHQNQMMQLLFDLERNSGFSKLVFEWLYRIRMLVHGSIR